VAKVLVVGQPGAFNLEAYISRAFLQVGWDVKRLNIYESVSPFGRPNTYARLLATRSNSFHTLLDKLSGIEAKVVSLVERERPDLLLVVKGEVFPPRAARRARIELGVRTVLWFPDDPRFLRSLLAPIAPSFENVVVSSRSTIPLMGQGEVDSIIHLPFACEPETHRSLKMERTFDVAFVGSYSPERSRLLAKLSRFDLKIWGPNWNLPWIPRTLAKHVMNDESFGEKFVEILNRSKIAINMHHPSDFNATGKINMRVFETAGCGTFQLTDHAIGLDEFFIPGQEVICYDSPEELVELIEYYLELEDPRGRISVAGQRRAYTDHTYVKRVSLLLEKIGLGSTIRTGGHYDGSVSSMSRPYPPQREEP
jgi:spore maturation protein CgeB